MKKFIIILGFILVNYVFLIFNSYWFVKPNKQSQKRTKIYWRADRRNNCQIEWNKYKKECFRWERKNIEKKVRTIKTAKSSIENKIGVSNRKFNMGEAQYHRIVRWYERGPLAIRIYYKLRGIGYSDNVAKLIINKCKKYWKIFKNYGIVDCIYALSFVSWAESAGFKRCYLNNCLWIMYRGKLKKYKTIADNIDDWTKKYYKYWYKWRFKWWVKFFYNPYGISRSHYCISDDWGHIWCPHWYKNAKFMFLYLKN